MRSFPAALCVPLLAAVAACSSGADVPPLGEAPEIAVSAIDTAVDAQELALDSGAVFIRKLTFVPCDPQAASLGTSDFPVNLFVFPPSSLVLDSAVSDYCRIQVELATGKAGSPYALDGASVHVTGARADGTTFELASAVGTSLDFASGTPFDASRLFLGVDFDTWFADANLEDAELEDDEILIDAEHNGELLDAFDAATTSAISLYVDADLDGELTDAELEPVARATTP